MPVNINAKQYYDEILMYNESLLYGGSTEIVWFSPKRKWGIWSGFAFETCVLAVHHDIIIDEHDNVLKDWHSLDFAMENWMRQLFRKPMLVIPDEIKETLILNYAEEN